MNSFSSIEAYCKAIDGIAPYTVGWAFGDIRVDELKRWRFADRRKRAYHDFEIPKKSGGTRKISAPTGKLKGILSCTAVLLNGIYRPNENAMGFVRGRSVKTNAEQHIGKNYVFNIDLSDFFPSISAQRVENALVRLGVDGLTAQLISTICSIPFVSEGHHSNVLPQGAPTSPVLSNIVCSVMDNRLQGLADRFHLTYTRYADDITFSSNHNVYHEDGEFFKELCRIIGDNGFRVNEKKTRLLNWGCRQEVTGLTVCKKVNVSRKWLKALRAAIFQLERSKTGYWDIQQVTGRVAYLGMVKGKDDPTYRKLHHRLMRITYFYRRRTRSAE